jgi:glycosyltransferase involved in cell wall biosynthesis
MKDCPELAISAIVLNDGKLATWLKESGIPTIIIDESKNNFLRILKKIRTVIEENEVDILHAHRYKENILGAMAARPPRTMALVTTVHGAKEPFSGFKNIKALIYSRLNNYYLRRHFDRVIAVSDEIRGGLIQNLGREKVVTIHNAIDAAKIKPSREPDMVRKELGIKPSAAVIGVVGRMVPVKGLDVFLKMGSHILRKRDDVIFLLIGDGPAKVSLEKMALELKIDDRTIFTGFRNDVIDIINCLDILVLSSYHEGIPMVLLEGMALCKPVVATAVGGIVEVIENDTSGLLVERGDHTALAEACLRLLDLPSLRAELVSGAKKRLTDEYSIEKQRDNIINIYKGMLAKA